MVHLKGGGQMKFKLLIVFVCILFIGTALANDVKVTERTEVKGIYPTDYMTDQSTRRNFLAVAMASYPVVDNMLECVVSKSDSRNLLHVLQYYVDVTKKIRIHISVTGPEFRSYSTGKLSVKANHYYNTSINWNSTWKTGVYKVTFIIEVFGGKGGSTLVETYSFIVV